MDHEIVKRPENNVSNQNKNSGMSKDSNHLLTIHATAINGDKLTLQKRLTTNPEIIELREQMGRSPLIFAVLGDRADCVDVILRAGALVNNADNMGRTALHWAAHKGNFQCAKLLLSKGAKWNLRDHNGMTALHLASRQRSHRCLSLILKYLSPGEIDIQDNFKRTALHWSALFGNVYHIRLLVKQDANIGIPDIEGKTPLHWAASCKLPSAVQCAKILLEHAPSVINWQDYEGRTALHLTVADGTIAVADVLTSVEKCNINSMDNMFRTPLHWAAVLGKAEIVKLFLDRKADPSSSDSNGATPLHYAAQINSADTVDIFLSFPAIKDEPDMEGRKALLWAASKGADDVVRVMNKHGVDLSMSDKNGATALHAAALMGHVETCHLLLEFKGPLEAQDLMRHTPLFYACEAGQADVVQTLLDFQANIHWLDIEGKSALHWAALGGHTYICQILILRGLNPNATDLCGRTALHCAAFGGYDDSLAMLIENGADHSIPDNEGMTPLHWSCSKGHVNVVKVLLRYGTYPNHLMFTDDRFTPLDLALLGEHYDVAQCLMEHGGISINRIQNIAATKIQAYYRGYCIRKNFNERRKLLVKHEQLKKKRAGTDALRSSSVQSKASMVTTTVSLIDDGTADIAREDILKTKDEKIQNDFNNKFNNKENFLIESNILFKDNLLTDTIVNKRHHSAGCFSQSMYSQKEFSLDSEEDSWSEDTDDDGDDDGSTFKHLESRGIKLNRKRFPGRPHSSGEIHNLETPASILQRIIAHSKKDVNIERFIEVNKNTNKELEKNQENMKSSIEHKLSLKDDNHLPDNIDIEKATHMDASRNLENESTMNISNKTEKEHPKLSVEFVKSSCLDMVTDRKAQGLITPNSRPKTPESNRSRLGILKSLRKKLGRQKETTEDDSLAIFKEELNEENLQRTSEAINPIVVEKNFKANTADEETFVKHHNIAALVIQRSWRRYKKTCCSHHTVASHYGCIHTEARKAAEEIWNQCLSTVSVQMFATSQSTSLVESTEEIIQATRCSSALPLVRQSSHYSYNMQNIRNIK